MKFLLCQTGMILLAMNATFGQGSISGTITDANHLPLSDVTVFIESLDRGTVSNRLGHFFLKQIQPGTYEVSVTSIGYKSQNMSVTVSPGESLPLQIAMERGELVLADVVITDQLETDVNTISQVDIKLRPITTSQDILRMIPGLFIAQHAGGGKAEQIFLRGFDIDHGTDISLEVDGLPVNMVSHAHGQGYSDLHFLIPEIVGSVDFNKGPYNAEKGNLATAGYASFRTKSTLEENIIKVEGGRFGTFRNVNALNVLSDLSGEWRQNAYVASEYFRTDGFFDENQHFNRLNLMSKYHAHRGDREALTIGLSTFNSRWDASGQIPLRAIGSGSITRYGAIDPTEGGETSRTNAWVKHQRSGDSGGVLENQFYFSAYDFKLISNFTFFLNDPVNGDQITQSESRKIYGYKGAYYFESFPGTRNLHSEVGAGFRYDDINDIHLSHTRSRKQHLNSVARGDIDETNLYAYVSETLSFNERLSVNGAVRLDHFTFNYVDALTPDYERQSVSKAVVSPKLNISYQASQKLNIFAKSGIGFHSNDTRVVVAREGREVLPKAYGLDLGANIKVADRLLLSTALWTLDLDQEFVYVGDEGVVEPGGKTQRRGIDLSLRYQPLPWLYFDTDINWTDPKAKDLPEGEDYVPLAPTLTSIGGISFVLENGFNGTVRYRYLGDRAANEDNSVVAQGYVLLDAMLKYTRRNFEISLSAENLLNEEWREAQFNTESRLRNEANPVSEIHFTPGTPLSLKMGIAFLF